MDKKLYNKLIKHVFNFEQNKAVELVLEQLEKAQQSVLAVYEELLIPAMKEVQEAPNQAVWQEHLRTTLLQTVLESTFLFVVKAAQKSNGKVAIIASPEGEYGTLGALIAKHYFVLAGFETHFVGANNPVAEILNATEQLKADFLTIGLTNYYNIISSRELVDEAVKRFPNLRIIVGGPVFRKPDAIETVKHHHFVRKYEEILSLAQEKKA